MMKKKNERNESSVRRYLGISYVRIPRKVLNQVFSKNDSERQMGRLYLAMFTLGNFAESTVISGSKQVNLKRGGLWVSLSKLARYTGIPQTSLRRYVLCLKDQGLIEIEIAGKQSRIRIVGYDLFASLDTSADAAGEGEPQASPASDLVRRVAEEERRLFGERKQRMDLLNYSV